MIRSAQMQGVLDRLVSYRWWEVAIELVLIWIVAFLVVRFVQGTRAAGALKGILVIAVLVAVAARVLGREGQFDRLGVLYERVLALLALGLVVIFQPELRQAATRVGEAAFFRGSPGDFAAMARAVADACGFLSKARFGAIIAIERQVGLGGLVEGGTRLDAAISAELLKTIFFPGSALHDLGVVVRGRTVVAAGVQFPLADPADVTDPSFGSRHRAAIGLTKECDALVVVVSEETGLIRLAERGKLSNGMSAEQLRTEIIARLRSAARQRKASEDDGSSEAA